jgi:isoleucyl-tRNA synthetase
VTDAVTLVRDLSDFKISRRRVWQSPVVVYTQERSDSRCLGGLGT